MAYNEEKLARLKHLKQLAQKAKAESDAVATRVKALEDVGAQANVLETIKVNGVVQSIEDKAVDIKVPGYTVEKSEKSGDYAAVYRLMKDGVAVGAAINIPKDMVVKSGSVVTNPTGQPKGTYIKLVLANATNDTLYVDVGGLIEYVTSGSAAGDMVVIAIDEQTHKVHHRRHIDSGILLFGAYLTAFSAFFLYLYFCHFYLLFPFLRCY